MFKNLNFKNSFKISNLKFQISHERTAWFILIVSFMFTLLRLPSLFEPYWYGDEGIYEVIGFALRNGRLLYSGIWDNKPPMLYLIYSLFSGDQMGAKFLSLVAGLGAIWVIFFLSKKLFVKFFPSALATALFAFLFAIPLIEGNIANAENFMLLLNILAGLIIWKVTVLKTKDQRLVTFQLLTAGILLGLSFLTKVVALFDLSAFAVFLFVIQMKKISFQDIVSSIKPILLLVLGFLIPIFLCVGFFVIHHTFTTFLRSTLFSNVGYVNYGNQYIIPQGFLILKTLLVGIAALFLFVRRKYISHESLFIYLWIIFSVYASLFSGRPYTHYMLVVLPSFSLLIGLFFANKKSQAVSGIVIILLIIFVTKSFTFYSKSFAYYGNFLRYVFGQESQTKYFSFFDNVTPRDYALSEFVRANLLPSQTIFVWGNSGQIYKLTNTLPSGRFIVAYHVTMTPSNTLETQIVLQKNPPQFIILLPNQPGLPYSLAHYQERLMIDGATLYEHAI